ncbi:MAG: Mov34/MPN/PAD-1 family protein [Candidatus Micrarchaeia archaeon]
MDIAIKRRAFAFALEAARRTYPREFIGLLRKNRQGIVSEVLIIPLSTFGHDFSSIDLTMVPALSRACGSVHSHPKGPARPSPADLAFFSRTGDVHIILGYPFVEKNARAYDSTGRPLSLRTVP